ncbi:hypothetical protein BDZ97DRAFT_1916390 [Flammula alnicola]|nr:hypothetical protein BDZ97DRAFT_1916390 [Flammula alnicola]
MNGEHTNAVAGPSTLPSPTAGPAPHHQPTSPFPLSTAAPPSYPSDSPPLLFLPPSLPPPPKQHLASTQDLLARFHLLPAYDRYVRPFVLPGDDSALQQQPPPSQHPLHPLQQQHHGQGADGLGAGTASPGGGGLDKGKGREREGPGVGTPADADLADAGDADDDDAPGAKGEKKKKNTYKHLIKGVPGKHSLKKDDYLTTMMLVPPKQRMRIHHFDAKTQEDAFTVSLEGLKGWNVNTLVVESVQAREDRKKRKELKRLAKLQVQTGGQQTGSTTQPHPPGTSTPTAIGTPLPSSTVAHPQPVHAPVPSVFAASRKMSGVGTPRPGSRAAGHVASAAGVTTASGAAGHVGAGGAGGASGGGVPRSTVPRPGSTVPRPGSAVPRPGSTVPHGAKHAGAGGGQQQRVGTPVGMLRTGTPMEVDSGQRGKKRERDEGAAAAAVNANANVNVNGVLHANPTPNPYAAANGLGLPNGNGVSHAGYANGNTANANVNGVVQAKPGVMNAKAGTGNIRPRPVKKQRMDVQGQARDVTQPVQQQPTPQGV